MRQQTWEVGHERTTALANEQDVETMPFLLRAFKSSRLKSETRTESSSSRQEINRE